MSIDFSSFNDAAILATTNQFGYNLGKSVHMLLSQIQEYVFEFNLSHQSQKTETDDMVKIIFAYIVIKYFQNTLPFSRAVQ